jgi:hypothetical protein
MVRRNGIRTKLATLAVAGSLLGLAPGGSVQAGHVSGPYFDLGAFEGPDFTGKQVFDGLKQFVADYPYRLSGTPNEIRAGVALHQEMDALGYEASTCSLAPQGVNRCVEGDVPAGAGLKVIMGKKVGKTRPNDWIMLLGHYDTVPQTIDGAYDNGAGTNFIRFMARELADIDTNRSIVFAFYNGEEEGLLASAQHASQLQSAGQQITAALGFDMVGIAWPVGGTTTSRNCLCIFRGAADGPKFDPLAAYVNHEFLGFPSGNTQVKLKGPNTRNSDESSFASRGFPTMRWAGMHTAGQYVAYHLPNDTIATIISEAGGEQFYEAGIENTLKSVYYTTLALDNHLPEPSLSATTSGLTVSVDGTASTDSDGALTGFAWDFGDGTTGTGATAEHTYAAPGTYTVILTVDDNLHAQVKRSATATVTVG